MRVIVAVNDVREISERQTTALLVAALIRQGRQVWLAAADSFSAVATDDASRVVTFAAALPIDSGLTSAGVQKFARSIRTAEIIEIVSADLLLIRTNPGRDPARATIHETFLDVCRVATSIGIRVINAPHHLRFFASKASLLKLKPHFFPPSIVSCQPGQITNFIRQSNQPCVVKPLAGSRGNNVVQITPDRPDLAEHVANLLSGSAVIAQHFVSNDRPGDQRIVVCGGAILEIEGQIGGIERHPAVGDFRANLHAGGTPHPVALQQSSRVAVQFAAELLNEHGIWLAGVDLIGDKIIEFNVFSTGGLYFAEKFTGLSFSDAIATRLFSDFDRAS